MHPILTINAWLENEISLGSASPNRIIVATASKDAIPSARVVAIREINENGVLFFTQRGTRKVKELNENEHVSAVLWLPLQQRQVTIEGIAKPISDEENLQYWQTMPHERQLRFCAYAPTSGQVIASPTLLEDNYSAIGQRYKNTTVPMSEFYCGYRITPTLINFYTLGSDSFSEVKRYITIDGAWKEEIISP